MEKETFTIEDLMATYSFGYYDSESGQKPYNEKEGKQYLLNCLELAKNPKIQENVN